ncbi:MAG: acetyl-CoA C-acetyltransferase [Pseudomonadota bacterium]
MDCYIYDHVRTPRGRGKRGGGLRSVSPLELGRQALHSVRLRNDLDTSQVNEVILGCVEPVGEQGGVLGRLCALKAGYDDSVAGLHINRYCSSGLDAVNTGAASIACGQSDIVIGGGVESMSRVPMGTSGSAGSVDPSVAHDHYLVGQAIGADTVATKYGFTREDVDRFAAQSQQRAHRAWTEGYFANSVIPVTDQNGVTILDRDEHIRPDTTTETLSALKPSFAGAGAMGFDDVILDLYPELPSIDHVHHAGNSSGIVDGASAVLMGNAIAAQTLGAKPRARIRGFSTIGSEPSIMMTGPEYVVERLLNREGVSAANIDLWEVNEAFAAVPLRFMQALDIDENSVNVNGGAIAMGHPLGATGAMLLGTLLDELERQDKTLGIAVLCVGVGMGTATLIERI